METIERNTIKENWWAEMEASEAHHDHKIVMDHGRLRWQEVPAIAKAAGWLDLNDTWAMFHALGLGKNSELVRNLYRGMGYTLFGYWELFYWEVNNPDVNEYMPPVKSDTPKPLN